MSSASSAAVERGHPCDARPDSPSAPVHAQPVWQVVLASLLGLSFLLASLYPAGVSQANPLAEAIGYLKKEQSLAESYAGLLKGFGKQDIATYARGIQLYAEAKAEFDGLIEQLLVTLRQGESPDTSATFQQKLEKAANRRVAFTDFIAQEVLSKVPEGTKSLAAILKIAGVAWSVKELVTALKDAGMDHLARVSPEQRAGT